MIRIKNIDFSYRNHRVFNNLSIDINKYRRLAIIGRNGSGKSTFIKLLNGLLKFQNGSIFIDNIEVIEDNLMTIRKKLSMVFQNPENQIIAPIVEQDVAFTLENLAYKSSIIRERVDWALKKVMLYDKRFDETFTLSGGQKQALAIASCLALKSEYIVFDEVTSMLDPYSRVILLELLRKLNLEDKITIIYITQDMSELDYFDDVLVFDNGNIIFYDNLINFYDSNILEKLSFDKPLIKKFYSDLEKDIPNYKKILNIGDNI